MQATRFMGWARSDHLRAAMTSRAKRLFEVVNALPGEWTRRASSLAIPTFIRRRIFSQLMYRPSRDDARVKLDFAKGVFVAVDVLLQQGHQGLGLLRAQINALEVPHFHLRFGLLLQGAEDEKEIPHVDSDLHAVGVVLPIIGSINKLDVGLCRDRHSAASLAALPNEKKRRVVGADRQGMNPEYPSSSKVETRWLSVFEDETGQCRCAGSPCLAQVPVSVWKRLVLMQFVAAKRQANHAAHLLLHVSLISQLRHYLPRPTGINRPPG